MERIRKIISNMDKTRKNYVVFDCDETIIKGDVERLTLKYQLEFEEFRIGLDEMKNRLKKYDKFKDKIENLNIKRDFSSLVNEIYREYRDDITGFLLSYYTEDEVYNLTKKAITYYKEDFSKREYIEKLFNLFKENNIEIYICSASIIYEVYVAADLYNLKRENVLACNNKLMEDNILSGYECGLITRGIGKVDAIKSLGYGYPPLLIAGDSDGDYQMLRSFDIEYGMIINPRKNTKVFDLVDNIKYFSHII
ncbi:HAD family hydrolase [Oceanivirga miroungae]|uniref:phosphoserine phosphatase n=1 Tax=Oceanivirga miroungae TaxID=1130046 RepID=A0A6I8MCJ3_9FUSO|nr:haloacid dehalogenase-like hydrolase [Oceanivirga miroungae]VWL85966.1 hypothetical protein OMES3154_01260 [Oceanivirga miroungae]